MVGLTVMGSISMGLSNVGWLFGVMDILQRYFRGYDIWPRRVNSQLQRAQTRHLSAASFLTFHFHFHFHSSNTLGPVELITLSASISLGGLLAG